MPIPLNRLSYHWIRQALVAISEIGGQPPGRVFNDLVGPLAIGELQRLKPLVLSRGIFEPLSKMLVELSRNVLGRTTRQMLLWTGGSSTITESYLWRGRGSGLTLAW
jgi:hypothetical protein